MEEARSARQGWAGRWAEAVEDSNIAAEEVQAYLARVGPLDDLVSAARASELPEERVAAGRCLTALGRRLQVLGLAERRQEEAVTEVPLGELASWPSVTP